MEFLGGGIFSRSGTLYKALKMTYPEMDLDKSQFLKRGKKSTQRWLHLTLSQILPEGTEILEDFWHPDLLWGMKVL